MTFEAELQVHLSPRAKFGGARRPNARNLPFAIVVRQKNAHPEKRIELCVNRCEVYRRDDNDAIDIVYPWGGAFRVSKPLRKILINTLTQSKLVQKMVKIDPERRRKLIKQKKAKPTPVVLAEPIDMESILPEVLWNTTES